MVKLEDLEEQKVSLFYVYSRTHLGTPTSLPQMSEIDFIGAGYTQSFALNSVTGDFYTFGSNSN